MVEPTPQPLPAQTVEPEAPGPPVEVRPGAVGLLMGFGITPLSLGMAGALMDLNANALFLASGAWNVATQRSHMVRLTAQDADRSAGLIRGATREGMLRNDPDLSGEYGGRLSVRPIAWRDHVPGSGAFAGDGARVGIPAREILGWRDYLSVLWEAGPMFLIGTKSEGLVYIPEHPTLLQFLREAPRGGWKARTVAGSETRVVPEPEHVAQSDWTYLGAARIRWKWRNGGPGIDAFLKAWDGNEIETLLAGDLVKVVIENRCNSAQPPGEELVSVALVAGLLANLDETVAFTMREPYPFWVEMLEASTTLPLSSSVEGRPVPALLRELIGIARRGLVLRGEAGVDAAFSALEVRLDEKRSPAERVVHEAGLRGPGGVMDLTRLGPGPPPPRDVPTYFWKR